MSEHFTRALARLDEVDALGETRQELFYLHTVAREVERVADHTECIATVVSELEEPLSEGITTELESLSEVTRDAVETAVDAVFAGGSVEAARDVLDAKEATLSDLESLERELFEAQDADYRLVRVLDSLGQTVEHASRIAEAGLRQSICCDEDADVADDVARTDGERQSSAT
ncbi:hypothetical protein [Haloferax sp. DFSO60]|uniref:hypothetical protein n=1 Tax=Haloferax sp. DFSO60 TaxID=3388652 RepID=UPI003978E5A8